MGTIRAIQYLRAAAALAVVIFHAAEKTGHDFTIGAAGVDVFFVISGFIMWVICDRRPVTPAKFIADRLRRIVPVYWFATAVMISGALAGLFPNLVLTLDHVLASLVFIPVRSPSSGEIWPVLVQGWTLNFEMLFYAVFAASLLLPRHLRLPAITGLFMALVAVGLVARSENALLLTYTRPIILEFVAGMILGEFWLRGKVPGATIGSSLIACSLGGFALIGGLHLPFDERTTGPLAVLLVLGALSLEASGRVPMLNLPALLGNASYSIYLWHAFAISVVAKAGGILGLPAAISMGLAIVAGTLAGIAAYAFLERPLVQQGRTSPSTVGLTGPAAQ
ncbi:acyltransferase family protein [Sinorhizobium americanum]|uniref:Exopolysaccharide production protein ExoZ n=1 Tax=Sinorhizobium americanum TaxID=194963 RepID=A0A1L3LXZ8_9HYPH|nr:acyltransferase [Sinorhizobium americanum]APG94958.1 exopolysaccharide production protein ExoZ [Sinorhizobium americanum]OAP37152.1 exopolysaccharide biosynthesis protein [Sinorhizobium americanum]